jgi:hypothetical protein
MEISEDEESYYLHEEDTGVIVNEEVNGENLPNDFVKGMHCFHKQEALLFLYV